MVFVTWYGLHKKLPRWSEYGLIFRMSCILIFNSIKSFRHCKIILFLCKSGKELAETYKNAFYNRRIRLTCLHPRCHPIQITWLFLWAVTTVLLVLTTCTQSSVTNFTIVTAHRNHHMICICCQQGCKHASRIRISWYVWVSYNTSRTQLLVNYNCFQKSAEMLFLGRIWNSDHVIMDGWSRDHRKL